MTSETIHCNRQMRLGALGEGSSSSPRSLFQSCEDGSLIEKNSLAVEVQWLQYMALLKILSLTV